MAEKEFDPAAFAGKSTWEENGEVIYEPFDELDDFDLRGMIDRAQDKLKAAFNQTSAHIAYVAVQDAVKNCYIVRRDDQLSLQFWDSATEAVFQKPLRVLLEDMAQEADDSENIEGRQEFKAALIALINEVIP